jgi:hypothetical protein
MTYIKILWRYKVAIILIIICGYLWNLEKKNENKRQETERKILAEAEEKKKKEQILFEKYNSEKNASKCNINYQIKLETYGENVTVELRVGELGNSFPLVIKQAKDGDIAYSGLCPGKYFIAIGNDKNVSTTPVQDFVTNTRYNSKVQLTQGVGNMSSSRREKL